MELILSKFGWLIGGAVGVIVWMVRLESVALSNRRDIKRLWVQRREDMDAAKAARDETNEILKELRDDIKQLLRGRN
tara:strand:- start:1576 stop:1806 length:231 start_codon:yes stop_codon:yes gene_type:complete